MSSARVELHISRSALWLLALVLIAPWIMVGGWLLTRRAEPAAPPAPAPALAGTTTAPRPAPLPPNSSDATVAKPGPWGNLESFRTLIEPPEEFVPLYTPRNAPRPWIFRGYTETMLAELWRSAGLDAAQLKVATDPFRREATPKGIVFRPDRDFVIGLSPAVRGTIYAALAPFSENELHTDPFRVRPEAVADWFEDSDLPPAAIELTKRMFYERGNSICFSDDDIVLPTLEPDQRSKYLKVLSRKTALMVQLRVPRGSDIAPLVRYWGHGRRSKDLTPLLQSLARRPQGGAIDIIHLLPPFARAKLYTYPLPSENPADDARDCHWTSLNFFNDEVDDRFLDVDHVRRTLLSDYYRVLGEPAFGDILMFTRPDGSAIHSCVYVADDIVFTKNGPRFSVPWLLSPLESVLAFYSSGTALEVRRYRAKNR